MKGSLNYQINRDLGSSFSQGPKHFMTPVGHPYQFYVVILQLPVREDVYITNLIEYFKLQFTGSWMYHTPNYCTLYGMLAFFSSKRPQFVGCGQVAL